MSLAGRIERLEEEVAPAKLHTVVMVVPWEADAAAVDKAQEETLRKYEAAGHRVGPNDTVVFVRTGIEREPGE